LLPAGKSYKNTGHYEFESDDDDDVHDPDFKPSKYRSLYSFLIMKKHYTFLTTGKF
jgi:hypothetical protein